MMLMQTKKVISMNYGSSKNGWKPWRWVRFDLIFTMRDWCINSNLNPLIKFTTSSRSIELKDILRQNISQMIINTIPISMRTAISYAMKRGIPFLSLTQSQWKLKQSNDLKFLMEEKPMTVEQTLASEEINKSKRGGLQEPQSGIQVGKLTIWVGSFEIEKL